MLLDGTQLYLLKRDISVPFQVQIATKDMHSHADTVLQCTEILRVLPQRRIVCKAGFLDHTVLGKFFLHPDKAEQDYEHELAGYNHLHAAGIVTPRLITSGSLNNAGFYVLYEYIDNASSLQSHIALQPDETSLAHIKQLITIVAAMHHAGIQQIDLHLNNFLLTDTESADHDQQTAMITIDCGDVVSLEQSAKKRQQQRCKNLADILSQLPIIYDQYLVDFLQLYEQPASGAEPLSMQQLCRDMKHWRRWRISKYLKKAARNCTEFIAQKNWRELRVCKRDYADAQWQEFYQRLDELVESSPRLKDGNTATVALAQCGTTQVVIKRYNIKHLRHWLGRFWRPSRAWKSWQNAHQLAVLGISTPEPIAIIEQRFGWLRNKAFYLSKYDAADDVLTRYSEIPEVSSEHLHGFQQLFSSMIAAQVSHGDLKANNILLSNNGLSFIDLDAMQFHHSSSLLGPSRFDKAMSRDLRRFMKNWPAESTVYQQFEQIIKNLPKKPVC